jgi:putative spermidine/putrescine transport system permease protein
MTMLQEPETVAAKPEKPSLKHRLAERGIDRTLLLVLPGLLFVVVLFAYPVLYGVQLSFQPTEGGGPFANYAKFFSDPYLFDTIWITLRLAIPAALINVLASIPIAFRMRGRVRGKRFLTILFVLPITLGTVLTAEALLRYFNPAGWFNRVLEMFGADEPAELINNYWGVLLSLIITGFPFAFLLTLSYLSGIDPTLEQAAATLGADWRKRFRHITLPLLAPGLAITFCLTFVLAFSVFPSAYLVGLPQGETRVMSIAAYESAFRDLDYPLGAAIANIMAVVMLAVIALVLLWRSTLYRGATGGKG